MEKFQGFTWVVGGEAGFGINVSAEILSKSLVRHGYYVFSNIEYESLIRGGHSYYRVRFSDQPINSHVDYIDILLALDDKTLIGDGGEHTYGHLNELIDGSILIYDEEYSKVSYNVIEEVSGRNIEVLSLPMTRIVKESTAKDQGRMVMRNMAGLGATAWILNLDLEIVKNVIRERFGGKKADVIRRNIDILVKGYNYASKHYKSLKIISNHPRNRDSSSRDKYLANGNTMAVIGSVKAGVKFWCQYPMAPATGMLTYIERIKDEHDIIVIQPESELAVINMALGASYAGARTGIATSGGGFALMTEAISFASMAEIPIVIFEVSRSGPSTGMPTRTEQGDLLQILYAGQSNSIKAIILPGDPLELYYDAQIAYNIADKYQIPVIVHYDKHLAESYYTFTIPENLNIPIDRGLTQSLPSKEPLYKRYAITENGISPRPIVGKYDLVYLTTSLEHDEYGLFTEDSKMRVMMENKRIQKMNTLKNEISRNSHIYHPIKTFGKGEFTIVSWGSTKGVIIDAVKYLNQKLGREVFKFIQVRWASPFPDKELRELLRDAACSIILEANSSGQMEALIRKEICVEFNYRFRKYDGRPFSLNEVVNYLREVLKHEGIGSS